MTKAMKPYRIYISCLISLLLLGSCVTKGSKAASTEKTQKDSVLQSDKCNITNCGINEPSAGSRYSEHYIYDVVEHMPIFPGGMAAMMEFINQNKRYPKDALLEKVQGRVIISFVVEKDGSLSNIEVHKGVKPSLDKEAVRIVKSMPKWKPGTQDGKNVRVRYCIPVSFKLYLQP